MRKKKENKKPREQSFYLTQWIFSPITAEMMKKLFEKTETFLYVPDIRMSVLHRSIRISEQKVTQAECSNKQ